MSEERLKRIEELMALDPELDTPEGEELNRLVDEQITEEERIFKTELIDTPTP